MNGFREHPLRVPARLLLLIAMVTGALAIAPRSSGAPSLHTPRGGFGSEAEIPADHTMWFDRIDAVIAAFYVEEEVLREHFDIPDRFPLLDNFDPTDPTTTTARISVLALTLYGVEIDGLARKPEVRAIDIVADIAAPDFGDEFEKRPSLQPQPSLANQAIGGRGANFYMLRYLTDDADYALALENIGFPVFHVPALEANFDFVADALGVGMLTAAASWPESRLAITSELLERTTTTSALDVYLWHENTRGVGLFHDLISELHLGLANTFLYSVPGSIYTDLVRSRDSNLPCPRSPDGLACTRSVYTLNDRYEGNDVQLYCIPRLGSPGSRANKRPFCNGRGESH